VYITNLLEDPTDGLFDNAVGGRTEGRMSVVLSEAFFFTRKSHLKCPQCETCTVLEQMWPVSKLRCGIYAQD
jgi:hypothetical protein